VRNYTCQVLEDILKQIHYKYESFSKIIKIDLSHQLIGDANCERLCIAVNRATPLQAVNLSGNQLTDIGIQHLSDIIRSLRNLRSLNLSWNLFTNKGVQLLMQEDKYSPSLQEIDLTYNVLTHESAYYICQMFQNTSSSQLHTLRLGGIVSGKSWGDEFLLVLLSGLSSQHLQRLRALHIPDFNLTNDGIHCIIAFLICDNINLDLLNISCNFIEYRVTRDLLQKALQCCSKEFQLQAHDCGFSTVELKRLYEVISQSGRVTGKWLSWDERLGLAYTAVKALNSCHRAYFTIKQYLLNTWKLEIPLKWNDMYFIDGDNKNSNILQSMSSRLSEATDSWSRGLRHSLFILTEEARYVHKLPEITAIIDKRKIAKEGDVSPAMEEKRRSIASELDLLIAQTVSHIDTLEYSSRTRLTLWNNSVEYALSTVNSTFHGIKLTMKNQADVRVPVQQREQVQFALEDALSHTIEQGQCESTCIGLKYKLRLLRFALVHQATAAVKDKSAAASVRWQDFVRKQVQGWETLGDLAFFIHYSFILLSKEKEIINNELNRA
jgi:Ran GTPase-activating protein (RanGAP) involved in mRNA processing and transport